MNWRSVRRLWHVICTCAVFGISWRGHLGFYAYSALPSQLMTARNPATQRLRATQRCLRAAVLTATAPSQEAATLQPEAPAILELPATPATYRALTRIRLRV